MTYRKVALDDLPNAPAPAREKKEVDEAVGADAFGLNVYTADPGEELPWGYHEHPDHEELFLVVAGELVVDTPDGDYRVGAVGAPEREDGTVLRETCPRCGEVSDRESDRDVETVVLRCADCGAETKRVN